MSKGYGEKLDIGPIHPNRLCAVKDCGEKASWRPVVVLRSDNVNPPARAKLNDAVCGKCLWHSTEPRARPTQEVMQKLVQAFVALRKKQPNPDLTTYEWEEFIS